jgi:hypothetical protein
VSVKGLSKFAQVKAAYRSQHAGRNAHDSLPTFFDRLKIGDVYASRKVRTENSVLTDEEYPVLTQFRASLDYAKIAEVRNDKHGRSGRLAEPFGSRMGWFSYDDLLKKGRAESQGITVYTANYWKSNRDAEIERCVKEWYPKKGLFQSATDSKEAEHRRLLALPSAGPLLKSEILQAFKIAARRVHPDAGGSDEEFKQLAAAKDALTERWRR